MDWTQCFLPGVVSQARFVEFFQQATKSDSQAQFDLTIQVMMDSADLYNQERRAAAQARELARRRREADQTTQKIVSRPLNTAVPPCAYQLPAVPPNAAAARPVPQGGNNCTEQLSRSSEDRRDFCERHGIQKYLPILEREDLEPKQLAQLSNEDLKRIGIPMGEMLPQLCF